MSTSTEPSQDDPTQGASKTEVDEPGWTPPETDPGPDR